MDVKQEKTINPETIRHYSANRFRICPYCQKEHYVKHLGKDFCSRWCADTFYNEKRRLEKQANKMLQEPIINTNCNEYQESQIEFSEADLKKNIAFLDKQPFDLEKGSIYHEQYLRDGGYVFRAYSSRGKLYNIPEQYSCHFLQVGRYRLFRTEHSQFLIFKQTL